MSLDPITLPWWQVGAVLVGLPFSYLSFSLFSDVSRRLWVERDHDAYLSFWGRIGVLHWTSAILVVGLLESNNYGLSSVGLVRPESEFVLTATVVVPVIVSIAYLQYVLRAPALEPPDDWRTAYVPVTTRERLANLGLDTITPAICEEFVYRGFAILALQGLGLPLWAAVILATGSFVFVHGFGGLHWLSAAFYAVLGLVLAGLFVATGSLLVPMAAHGSFNLALTVQHSRRLVSTADTANV